MSFNLIPSEIKIFPLNEIVVLILNGFYNKKYYT